MSELTQVIRFQGIAQKEYSVKNVMISGETPTLFETGLTLGYSRIGCFVYNNSDTASGEAYWGSFTMTPKNSFPIPVGSVVEVPIHNSLNFYLCASGERNMDLRVLEIS